MEKMKLNIQLFASNTINVPTQGYSDPDAYKFRLTVTLTGNTSGNTREVKIVYDCYPSGSGGYEYMRTPRYTITYDTNTSYSQTLKGSSAIPGNDIWPRNAWYQIYSGTKYLEAGKTYYFRATYKSNSSTAYMPKNQNYNVDVSLTLDNVEIPVVFNGTGGIKAINFNGTTIEHLYFNGTKIY